MKREGFIDQWLQGRQLLVKASDAPVIVVVGDQPFVKERLIDAAVEGHGGEHEVFSARPGENDASALQRMLDDWSTASLFGGGRLIIARAADKLVKGSGAKRFEAALAAGAPPNRLLLTVTALDGRTKLAKTIKQSGGLVSLSPLRDAPPPWHTGGQFLETDLNLWIVQEARLQGLLISLEVADELTSRVGNEPGRLAQTVGRLAILLGDRSTLTLTDVQQHVPRTSARLLSLYEDALRRGDAQEALSLVDRMGQDGVYDPFQKLVAGPLVTETVLRGLTASLAREVAAHDALGAGAVAALVQPPWKRRKEDTATLDAVLGRAPGRVFLERDLRRTDGAGARAAFAVAVTALRGLRDGAGANLHALTVKLCRAMNPTAARR